MSSTPQDRKAKAQAAAKVDHGGGANKILVAGIVAVVALAAIIAGTILANRSGDGDGGGGGAQAVPAGVAKGEGLVVNADKVKGKKVPTVEVYEDFRCPVCKVYEQGLGATTQELAEQGKIKLVVHLKTVIDASMGGDASKVAASNALCAADQDAWFEYHQALFAKQPATEGDAFSDADFAAAADEAGITGAKREKYDACVADQRYTDYVQSVDDASSKNGINATPVVVVDGVPYNWATAVAGGDQQNPQFDTKKYAKVLTSGSVPEDAVNTKVKKEMDAAKG